MWKRRYLRKPGRLGLGILMAASMSTGLVVVTQVGAQADGGNSGHNYFAPVPACTRSHGRAYEKNPHCGHHKVGGGGEQDSNGQGGDD